ncbi:hypothetical protein HMPREF0322_02116 [Desulfitobacterium hafniense DP7]|uniref:Uncharacterized protein n=2 Tax=Desulfitobacterium hafniense TaxID=49338 RepID=A0A0W1JI94_DESHA|nr:hypothetical protein HMPREF0322_02116 [Desulfitobacterium hafniense DP7]KTE91054.1 hypothetical protein AT727_05490 [Desulfitobacterium hafniense]
MYVKLRLAGLLSVFPWGLVIEAFCEEFLGSILGTCGRAFPKAAGPAAASGAGKDGKSSLGR